MKTLSPPDHFLTDTARRDVGAWNGSSWRIPASAFTSEALS